MQPKMGKTDIDYQVLHDAFFNYQTMPELTTLGDLYHEGKEFEVKLREMKPELLSYELKEALGMPDGAPPPCLIKYAEIWSPSLYPHLKIPGLNAPIPTGASFGNHQQDQPNYEEEPVAIGVIWRERKKRKNRWRAKI
ncbi:pre-mRNA-splicing factor sap145-like isoform X2 [Rosa rugosa]|uniref:pre-mRNA-splicing factor sap145-like isoform X2 n=1 Tax=Rosa rugosa TaxID=74645 RepID=UPI002B402692|nr:pre-mRNA-splicing factor sap145-like isoform X2 [Rosa rugosa]